MKHILTLLSFLFVLGTARAQAPQGIPYQAAARNSSGAVLSSTSISVRFTIRDNTSTGIILYRETHNTTTNSNGMFSVNIGQGTPVIGTFASINWGSNAKFMQVELDPAGGSSYIDMGTQQMMSVPYALTASALKLTVSATGDTLYSGGGNYVIIPGISAANCTVSAGTLTGTATACVGSTTSLSSSVSGGVWSSSNTPIAPVTSGVVSGVSAGTATISYTVTNSCGSATTTIIVTVNPLPSAGTITGSATACVGSTTSLSSSVSGGLWSSSNTPIAPVTSGVVSGVSAGTATISYTVTNSCGSAIATRIVTVNPLPSAGTITGSATACIGSTTSLSSSVSGGVWSSSNTPIAPVTSGVVSGVSAGTATISYTVTNSCGSAIATRIVTVNPLPSAGTITGASSICAGADHTLSSDVTGGTWSSTNAIIAYVDETTGYLLGLMGGGSTATIIYTVTNSCGSATAHLVVTVDAIPYAGTITGSATACVGSTTSLSSSVSGGVWSSSNTAIAPVTSGVVSGLSAGTATISYTVTNSCGTATTTSVITVNPLPSAGIITGTATVTAGSTTPLSNATTGGTWSSSATGIATVGSTGVVTGVAAGTATISYTFISSCGSAVATRVVTVNALTIGMSYGGGIIAYILQPGDPGYIVGETHGIIAAPSDQGDAVWGCYGTFVGSAYTALGTGVGNTAFISASCGAGTATRLCADLVLGGFSDWYLPSRDELQKLYINRGAIGGFANGHYWSSSELSYIYAWIINFPSGNILDGGKASSTYVRAVRSF